MLYKDILLIDDDADDAEIFAEALSSLKKEVVLRTENNPVKALEEVKVSEKLPDLIFLDYNMPSMNGHEVLAKIKNEKKLQDIAVIMISSPAKDFIGDLLQKNQIVNYIRKPNSFCELVSILGTIL